MSRRAELRERRHAEIIAAAAAMIADRGFHVTRLEDVGQVVGISGPGLYRYVSGKDDMLAQILVDISVRLVDGARAVMDRSRTEEWAPDRTLRELLSFHVEFAVTEPDRIRVQEREIGNLAPQQREKVRSLQRMYISMWVETLRRSNPELTEEAARVRVQLAAGLINSSRHVVRWAGADAVRNEAMDMAFRAMDLPKEDDPDISDIARAALGGRPRSAGEITENGEPGTS
ncbi:TetR/AcrR family transcriptional regulator [Corynebacterium xerosis]|uniref:TetR family transcriptional regulator n=1 Tax=Corynebacterium xerosis TaxID=1725 RepID=A0ABV3UX14_9CORY|nr:TetR family transcriptional regulator [Corynebacterium xerosis]HJG57437.1 TetR/AcrR family transcriptional regulator [Corynebacterium xerosis]